MKPAHVGAVAALVPMIVLLVGFAMPVGTWGTGDRGLAPLTFEPPPPGSDVARLWIDTDAACGHSARTDPDDCLAIALLARAAGDRIAGISTVAGNAPLEVIERTTRELAARLSAALRVYSGSEAQQALADRPLLRFSSLHDDEVYTERGASYVFAAAVEIVR